jgi:F-type H+-transporting ATPase subunit delta
MRSHACFTLGLLAACIGLCSVLQERLAFVGLASARGKPVQVSRQVQYGPPLVGEQRRMGDGNGVKPYGPVSAYSYALMDAAKKKQQAVPVTKDVMKIRKKFGDPEFRTEYYVENNRPFTTDLQRAEIMKRMLKPLESDVTEKFITFLAKKRRLKGLPQIVEFYVNSLYREESIEPIVVTSAVKLSDEEKNIIKEKMKAKTGASEIKIIAKEDPALLGGFKVQWSFMDPDNLITPTKTEDLTLKNMMKRAALSQGIVVD